MHKVRVNLAERSYDICLQADDLHGLAALARTVCRGTMALVVTDRHVQPHAERVAQALREVGLQANLAMLPPGEPQKSLSAAAGLYDRLAELRADRKTLVV